MYLPPPAAASGGAGTSADLQEEEAHRRHPRRRGLSSNSVKQRESSSCIELRHIFGAHRRRTFCLTFVLSEIFCAAELALHKLDRIAWKRVHLSLRPLSIMTGLSVNPLQISGRRPQDMWASILFALFFAATIGITCVKGSSLKNLAASCTDSEGNLRSVGLHRARRRTPTRPRKSTTSSRRARTSSARPLSHCSSSPSGWSSSATLRSRSSTRPSSSRPPSSLAARATYSSPSKDSSLPALIMALIGALYILWLCCARRRIALTAKLVEQSVVVVSTHPGLFAVSGVLFVVKILSVALCFVSAIAVLASKITTTTTDEGQCELTFGELETFDMILLGVCTIFFWWTINIWLQMKRYIVSLVTGIWYYEHESLAAQEGTSQTRSTRARPSARASSSRARAASARSRSRRSSSPSAISSRTSSRTLSARAATTYWSVSSRAASCASSTSSSL